MRVGLGTDIAGGYSIDIMNAMRSAVMVSRMREGERKERAISLEREGKEPETGSKDVSINWKEALFLATRGGANTLGLPEGAGMFTVGAPFDAQLSMSFISSYSTMQTELYANESFPCTVHLYESQTGSGIGPLEFFDSPGSGVPVTEEMLEKWWCVGDTRNRGALWVQGRQ